MAVQVEIVLCGVNHRMIHHRPCTQRSPWHEHPEDCENALWCTATFGAYSHQAYDDDIQCLSRRYSCELPSMTLDRDRLLLYCCLQALSRYEHTQGLSALTSILRAAGAILREGCPKHPAL